MTAQSYEKLIYQGEEHRLAAEPLEHYFQREGLDSPFEMISTALYRGYVGTWEVVGGRLFLNNLTVPTIGFDEAANKIVGFSTDVPLSKVFPTADGPVFAEWYTGELRCPQGELKEYCHSEFASIYESDLLLAVKAGVISGATVRGNTRGRPHPDPTSFANAICDSCGYTKRLSIPPEFWDRLWLPIGPVWCSSCKDVTLANHDEQPLCCLECGSSDLQQPSEMRGRGGWKMAWRLLRHGLKHGQASTTLQWGHSNVVPFEGHYYGIVHRTEYRNNAPQEFMRHYGRRRYFHRLIRYDADLCVSARSDWFSFFGAAVEFCMSLDLSDKAATIGLGVWDQEAKIIQLDTRALLGLLE